jgi:hypothetical protein
VLVLGGQPTPDPRKSPLRDRGGLISYLAEFHVEVQGQPARQLPSSALRLRQIAESAAHQGLRRQSVALPSLRGGRLVAVDGQGEIGLSRSAVPKEHFRRNVADLESIYTIGGAGVRIWEMLDGQLTGRELRDRLVQEFEIEQEEAEADLMEFLQQLEEIGGIVAAEGQ